MKRIFVYIVILFLTGYIFTSCKKADTTPPPPTPINPCDTITITTVATKTFTITGQSVGAITVTSPIGSGYTYSIDGTTFQASTNFFNLAAGTYTVTTKSGIGCKGTTTATIVGYGAKYFNVKTIINGYCGPCHLNGAVSGGKNWDNDASVTGSWDRIKARAVDNLPTAMPQTPNVPLTIQDKQKITDWVNAGHRITD
jgi:uncharacterized membrane protein